MRSKEHRGYCEMSERRGKLASGQLDHGETNERRECQCGEEVGTEQEPNHHETGEYGHIAHEQQRYRLDHDPGHVRDLAHHHDPDHVIDQELDLVQNNDPSHVLDHGPDLVQNHDSGYDVGHSLAGHETDHNQDNDLRHDQLEIGQSSWQYSYDERGSSVDTHSLNIEGEQLPPYTRYESDPVPPCTPSRLRKAIITAKLLSSRNFDLHKRVLRAVFCSLVCSGTMVSCLGIMSVMVIGIGAWNMSSCPRQRYIPIYLVVGGTFSLFKTIMHVAELVRGQAMIRRREASVRSGQYLTINPLDGIIVIWFITGCVWIYPINTSYQSIDPEASDYCDHSFYQFVFWLNTTIFMVVMLVCSCCCALCITVHYCVSTIREDTRASGLPVASTVMTTTHVDQTNT